MKTILKNENDYKEFMRGYEYHLVKGGKSEPDEYPCIAVYDYINELTPDCDADYDALDELRKRMDIHLCEVEGTLFVDFVYPNDFEELK